MPFLLLSTANATLQVRVVLERSLLSSGGAWLKKEQPGQRQVQIVHEASSPVWKRPPPVIAGTVPIIWDEGHLTVIDHHPEEKPRI